MNSKITQLTAQLSEVTRERDAARQELIAVSNELITLRGEMGLPSCGPSLSALIAGWKQSLAASESDRERLRAALEWSNSRLEWVIQYLTEKPFKPWDNADEWLPTAIQSVQQSRAALAPALATEGESTQSKLDKAINALRIARDTTRGFVRDNQHDAWSFPEMDEILGPIAE